MEVITKSKIEFISKYLCGIINKSKAYITGFFCKIPFPDIFNKLEVIITNNEALSNIENNTIKINYNNNIFELLIDNTRRLYFNKSSEIAIIEIKQSDNLNIDSFFILEVDEISYYDIYSVYFNSKGEINYCKGKIDDNLEVKYPEGNDIPNVSPIFDFYETMVGVNIKNKNKVKVLKIKVINESIFDFYFSEIKKQSKHDIIYHDKNNKNENINDEITIFYKGEKINNMIVSDLKNDFKNIFGETLSEYKIFGEKFVARNKNLCKMIINGKEMELSSYLKNENNENLDINNLEVKLTGISNITDMSYMFSGCLFLNNVQGMDKLDTNKINNISGIFSGCLWLTEIPDISNWDTSNVTNISGIFYACHSLKNLPDISKWDTSNVVNMSGIFCQCKEISSLPDISIWNTKNVKFMRYLFHLCINLKNSFPDISKWNMENVVDISSMFKNCFNLNSLPNISKWNTKNLKNITLKLKKISIS